MAGAPKPLKSGRQKKKAQAVREPWPRLEKVIVVLIPIVAASVRLLGITSDFPVLTDEAIYMRWAEIIEHQSQWFIALLDGKQPLSYWLYALLRFAGVDSLLGIRGLSAVAGGLTALLVYAIGKRIAGPAAGLVGALCWTVFPWSMVYDRLALAEALVNLAGASIVYTTLLAFAGERMHWKRTALAAATVGLAFLLKSTTLLFLLSPILLGLWLAPRPLGALFQRWAVIFAAVPLVYLFLQATIPDAPLPETHNVVLHHTSRITSAAELASDPFVNARKNFPLLSADLIHYFPLPAALLMLGSFLYLAVKRSIAALIVVCISIVPIAVQLLVTPAFETRFAYPHTWPWMLAIGVAVQECWGLWPHLSMPRARLLGGAAMVLITSVSMALLSFRILIDPQNEMEPDDAGRQFGSYVHVAWGVPEAIDFLVSEAEKRGGFVLLTDPFWGVPADMAFAYLNERHGIRVHEAWWLQAGNASSTIVPRGEVEILKSHYERVSRGKMDFRKVPRVYYLTDTFYMPRLAVEARQPGAVLLKSFPKPEGNESVDVYRLK